MTRTRVIGFQLVNCVPTLLVCSFRLVVFSKNITLFNQILSLSETFIFYDLIVLWDVLCTFLVVVVRVSVQFLVLVQVCFSSSVS